ncbi:MAG: sulfatase-like hydrolase/transferase [Acidimicrobiales bacterium]
MLLALELAALAGFTFSRPVLDSFGRSPETFIARGATARDIVIFGLVVALGPVAAACAVGFASRVFGVAARRRVHLGLVAAIGGLAVWRLGQEITRWPGDATKLLIAGAVGVVGFGLLRWRLPVTGSFLRFAGAASVVFLVQFLVLSPTSDLVFGKQPSVDATVADQVASQVGDSAPNVVFLVFDALPVESLLDGAGHVDGEPFPNFARLEAMSTWYRNNTTVAGFTDEAVPAILTGKYPEPTVDAGGTNTDPENLFTLLGGTYEIHAREQVTGLCPEKLCPEREREGIGRLLGDAVSLWGEDARQGDGQGASEDELPGALGDERYEAAEEWIAAEDWGTGSRPDLFFYHLVMPHGPWRFTADGDVYQPASDIPTGFYGTGFPYANAAELAHQRHLLQLQAVDRLLGQVLDQLDAAGTLDDTLIVVTADHGEAFTPDTTSRALAAGNEDQIMWTPLFVKAPGQARPRVDDTNIETIDVLPTVASLLGIDMPWTIDGVTAAEAGREHGDVKLFDDRKSNPLRARPGEPQVEVDADAGFARVLAADGVRFTGPDAVWKRTAHGDLFGRRVETLALGDGGDGAGGMIDAESPRGLGDIDVDEPLPLEVVGSTDLAEGAVVAYALNGTIGAVTEVGPSLRPGERLALGLLPPDLFVDGENELTAYLVEGPVGDEVLHPLALDAH